jgi:hypothetical protein
VEKHTVVVGSTDASSTVGETVAFTADDLGTALVSGGTKDGGLDYTFYRLPDGTFRVLIEYEGMAILHPSNIEQAIQTGQRNGFSYGRMTVEEIKAEDKYQIGEVYEKFIAQHPETVRNTVRDLD